jgi:predicted GNAT superfamily acetyltransferase
MPFTIRSLVSVDDFARVFELERRVWALPNGDDAVPVNLFAATVKCGAILLGGFDELDHLAGFVYSFPGVRHGRSIQWSHMLGVDEGHRGRGLGRALKLAQRQEALAQGVSCIEWTFDPLQVENAHFNLQVLGAEAGEYLEDVYGASESPLHAGTATDRLVARWNLAGDRVLAACEGPGGPVVAPGQLRRDAVPVNHVRHSGRLAVCDGEPDLSAEAEVLAVRIPAAFTAMLRDAPDLARAWREHTRRVFRAYLERDYVAREFVRDDDGGRYLLARDQGSKIRNQEDLRARSDAAHDA